MAELDPGNFTPGQRRALVDFFWKAPYRTPNKEILKGLGASYLLVSSAWQRQGGKRKRNASLH